MANDPGVIYEVTLAIEQDAVEDVDAWLPGHVEEMLTIPGFVRARIFTLENDDGGRARRVIHYQLENEADLERYFDGPAAAMRQAGSDRFGDRFTASRRILHAAHPASGDSLQVQHCLNCKAALAGQYCAICGQRSRSRLISLWELVGDAFGDLFELDSRLWRTLIPLFARPGLLTKDYLEGRRARYMPPFRTYLVLSIVFFLAAAFDPRQQLQILFEPEVADTGLPSGSDVKPDAARAAQEILKELNDAGVVISEKEKAKLQEASSSLSIDLADGTAMPVCNLDGFEDAQMPPWLAKRLTKERLLQVCEKISADSGRDFIRKLLDNAPPALFFLLPLMALVLKLLYPLSNRYYVEHLLFVVHFHAFFFLILTLQILITRLGPLALIPNAAMEVTGGAVTLYIPVYLYKAMRRVYGQGHTMTLLKYLILAMAYAFGTTLVLLAAALIAAFSM
jgi:hypothetical protein